MKIQKVGIIGFGHMGSGIAQAASFRFGDYLDIDYFLGEILK
jgi:3-hydroxyacyl-CoA dehydrogenase